VPYEERPRQSPREGTTSPFETYYPGPQYLGLSFEEDRKLVTYIWISATQKEYVWNEKIGFYEEWVCPG
tara:strand:+ start:1083 stop:1289 length:207 start_codon:yes stop_codon:yes gene_type:complete